MITIIAAQDENGLIGSNGKLPWDCPNDSAWFHQMTMGCPVIMGRKTWEDSHDSKNLEGRYNIVVSRRREYLYKNRCHFVTSISEAIMAAQKHGDYFVIGGTEIYKAFLPLADRIFLTTIHAEYEGDTKFPEFVKSEWQSTWRAHMPGFGAVSQTYEILVRKQCQQI